MPPIDDLLIIADPRADFFEIVQRVRGGAGIEVRLDRRRGDRRRAADVTPADAPPADEARRADAPESEERRRRERRSRDITDELRNVGWVFIPASERGG